MTDQSLFNSAPEAPAVPNSQPPVAPSPVSQDSLFANQLAAIVDENGRQKYDSPDKALEALRHSQSYIPQLKGQLTAHEQEIATLKAELAKRAAVEDVVSRLTPPAPQAPATPEYRGLDEKAVEALLDQRLTQTETNKRRADNLATVEAALIQKFGANARTALSDKATELGIDLQRMREMSEDTPQLVHALFGQSLPTAPRPSTGSHAAPPSQPSTTMADRLKEAEYKILNSGRNTKNNDLIAELRRQVMAQHGFTN